MKGWSDSVPTHKHIQRHTFVKNYLRHGHRQDRGAGVVGLGVEGAGGEVEHEGPHFPMFQSRCARDAGDLVYDIGRQRYRDGVDYVKGGGTVGGKEGAVLDWLSPFDHPFVGGVRVIR